jgi:hypothetical protein
MFEQKWPIGRHQPARQVLHRPHADASCSHAHRIERVEQVEQDLLELNPVGDVLQRLAGTGVPF